MGTWGHHAFENDEAMDFVHEFLGLLAIDDGIALEFLRSGVAVDNPHEEAGVAVAAIITSLRGHPVASTPEEIAELSDLPVRADDAELALGYLDHVDDPNGDLFQRWSASDYKAWAGSLDELRKCLARPAVRRSQPKSGKAASRRLAVPGNVFEVSLASGGFAYIQYMCPSWIDGLIRVLPGRYSDHLDNDQLAHLVRREDVYLSVGDVKELVGDGLAVLVGSLPLPKDRLSQLPMRVLVVVSDEDPEGWLIKDTDGSICSSRDFRGLHPAIDQARLPETGAPYGKTLVNRIEQAVTTGKVIE